MIHGLSHRALYVFWTAHLVRTATSCCLALVMMDVDAGHEPSSAAVSYALDNFRP